MYHVVAFALLLVASAMLGEAQDPMASPKPSKAVAPTPKKDDTIVPIAPAKSPSVAAAPAPETKSPPISIAPSISPAASPSDAPVAAGPVADVPLASAPVPDAAEVSDQSSGAVRTGAFIGGAVAAWIAVSAF